MGKFKFKKLKFWKKKTHASSTTSQGKYSWTTEDGRTVSASMKPLIFKRQIKATALINEMGLGDLYELISSGITIKALTEALQKYELLEELLDTILIREPDCEKSDLLQMDYPVEKAVFADFLSLNPELLSDFGSLLMSRALIHQSGRFTPAMSRPSA